MNSDIPEQIKQAIKLAIVGAWPEALKRYAYSPHPSDESYMETPEQSAEAAAEILLTALAPHFTQQPKGEEIVCPFCGESDFDLVGLKMHITHGHCETFTNTARYARPPARLNTEIKTK